MLMPKYLRRVSTFVPLIEVQDIFIIFVQVSSQDALIRDRTFNVCATILTNKVNSDRKT